MSNNIEELKDKLFEKLNLSDDFKAVVAFEITDEQQTITVDATVRPVCVVEDKEPKFTLRASFKTYSRIIDGDLSPFIAIAKTQLKVDGSIGTAMHFLKVL